MTNIEIFKVSEPYLDGGSRDCIYTNMGIFKLVNKIGNPGKANGFYKDGEAVGSRIQELLQQALVDYSEVKVTNYKNKQLKESIEILIQALKTDEAYRRSWKDNIAMSFKDECYRQLKESLYTEYGDAEEEIHTIANEAADNFLKQLCS